MAAEWLARVDVATVHLDERQGTASSASRRAMLVWV